LNERSKKKFHAIEVACKIFKSANENFMNQTPLFVLQSNCISHNASHSDTCNERSNKKLSDIEVAGETSKSFNENFMIQTILLVLQSNCISHHVSHSDSPKFLSIEVGEDANKLYEEHYEAVQTCTLEAGCYVEIEDPKENINNFNESSHSSTPELVIKRVNEANNVCEKPTKVLQSNCISHHVSHSDAPKLLSIEGGEDANKLYEEPYEAVQTCTLEAGCYVEI